MDDDRTTKNNDSPAIVEMFAAIRRALAKNAARNDAMAAMLRELSPGAVPEGWPGGDTAPSLVRRPLLDAEAILRDRVGIVLASDAPARLTVPDDVVAALDELDRDALHDAMIEETLVRLDASWSYVDVVGWTPLIVPDETPILFLITLPLGKPHKKRQLLGEEHNLSGIHFHYAKLDGQRSDILFAFGRTPPEPDHPVTWERHGTSKAKFHPRPEDWNYAKRENINAVCCAARAGMAAGTRWFRPSKEAAFLLPA